MARCSDASDSERDVRLGHEGNAQLASAPREENGLGEISMGDEMVL